MTLPWYPFMWDDYSGSTFNLTQGQHGAHILFMRHIYTTGKQIPHKQRYSIARAMIEQEQSDADYVLSAHYKRNGEFWHSPKCDEVIEKAGEAHNKRVNAGKQGGKAKAERSSNAKAMPQQSSSKQNHNQNHIDNTDVLSPPISPKPQSGYSADFDTFWQTYPNRTGKAAAHKAYQLAIKQHGVTHAILIDRAGQFAAAHAKAGTPGQYIPHPATWLNAGRWDDDLSRIAARSNGTPPAANARGSQFNALQSALSEIMQEADGDLAHGSPGLPERSLGAPMGLQPAVWNGATSLPGAADRSDTTGGETIDHDPAGATDG